MKKTLILIFMVGITFNFAPAHAADWEGPTLVSFQITPNVIDVSNAPSYVNIEAHLQDVSGVASLLVQVRTGTGGTGGGADIILSKCQGTQTDCYLKGKLVIKKRSRPGTYVAVNVRSSDILSNSTNHSEANKSFEVLNNGGNPDPSEIPTLPTGVTPEDYQSENTIKHYNSVLSRIQDSFALLESELQKYKNGKIPTQSLPIKPNTEIWTGDFGADAARIADLESKAVVYQLEVRNYVRTLEVQNSSRNQTITCIKGKTLKKVSGINPKCPVGYRKK